MTYLRLVTFDGVWETNTQDDEFEVKRQAKRAREIERREIKFS